MATVWYKQVNPPQRKALFSAWLGYVFDGFDFMMIFYILHIIKADLGITDIQATLIGTVAFIARPIGGGFFGAMADKYGRKPMMMWAIIIYSVGTGLSGIATNLYMLAVCRFIVGLGMSGEYACASTYAVESWPKNLQSKASAFLVSGFSVGNIIAAQIIPQFAEVYGWRNSFFIGLLPVLLVLWIRKSAPESQEWIEDKYKDKSTFLSVFRKPHLSISMIVFLVCFCLFGANWPINGLLPSYLADNGVNTVVISTLMTIAGLGTLTGTIFFGFVGDKIGVKKTFVVGLITSFIFLCPLFFISVKNSTDALAYAAYEGNEPIDPRYIIEDGVCKMADHSALAGSLATMDVLVRTMVKKANIPLEDAVRMASETPARLIGVSDRKGALAKGKDADIVILDKELNVRCVWSMGKIVPGTDNLLHK